MVYERLLEVDQVLEGPRRFGLHSGEHVLVGVDRKRRVGVS